MRKLYELVGADPDRHFSQNCWRIRLALHLKGLDFESVPWRFSEREVLAFANTDRVPVLVDGERVVPDSWAILQYLEDTYPEGESLFGDAVARAEAEFIRHWTERVVHAQLGPMIMRGIWSRLGPADQGYFRETRQARFGKTLEELEAEIPERLPRFREAIAPLRATVEAQPFIAGERPRVPDLLIYAAFLWARHGSDLEPLAEEDPVAAWRGRMDAEYAQA